MLPNISEYEIGDVGFAPYSALYLLILFCLHKNSIVGNAELIFRLSLHPNTHTTG